MHAYYLIIYSSLPAFLERCHARNVSNRGMLLVMRSNSSFDICSRRTDAHSPVRQAHLRRECRVRHPGSAVSRIDLVHHLINLLERQTLGLRDKEVGKGGGDTAEGAPEEEDFRTEVGVAFVRSDEVGRYNCDDLKGSY